MKLLVDANSSLIRDTYSPPDHVSLVTMKKKLTLSIEESLVRKAKANSRKQGKSVSDRRGHEQKETRAQAMERGVGWFVEA